MIRYAELTDNPRGQNAYLILWLEMTDSREPISQDIRAKSVSIHSEYPVEQAHMTKYVQVLLETAYGTNYTHARQVLILNVPPWAIPLLANHDQQDALAMNKRLRK
jgi:hypothetical protein